MYVIFSDASCVCLPLKESITPTVKLPEHVNANLAAATQGDLKRSISRHIWIINSLGSEVADFLAYNGDICNHDDLVMLYQKTNDINERCEDAIDFMFHIDRYIKTELSKK